MKKIITLMIVLQCAILLQASSIKISSFDLSTVWSANDPVSYNTETHTITSTAGYSGYIQYWCESAGFKASKFVLKTQSEAGLKISISYESGPNSEIDTNATTFEIELDPTRSIKNIQMQTKAEESTGIVLTDAYLELDNVEEVDLTKFALDGTPSNITWNTSTKEVTASDGNWPYIQDWSNLYGKYATKMMINFSAASDVQLEVGYIDDNNSETADKVESRIYASNGTKQVVANLDPTRQIHYAKIIATSAGSFTMTEAALIPLYLSEHSTPALANNGQANVTLTRTLKVGWNTICLPFELTSDQVTTCFGSGAKVYEYTSSDASAVTVTQVSEMTAGKPYLLKMDETKNSITFTGVNVTATTPDASTVFKGNFTAAMNMQDKYGVTSNVIKKGASGATLKAFAGYFDFGSGAPAFFDINDGQATGISTIDLDTKHADDTECFYNLAGQRVNQPARGIFVKNGKKYIIK